MSFNRAVVGSEYCLSTHTHDNVREVVDCLRQLTTMSWMEVLKTAGKGENKAGLGYTPYSDDALKGAKRPAFLSQDVNIFGVRASQRCRVFGYYSQHIVYVLWFDQDHKIVPQK